ncbi:headcase protein homolog [Aplysia californica]|uniref:Headcase protein homolog n=1 Tax=Aplysia californica TaxID=6500 RepID=A0ABM0K606_APLCA|nr:headcase protein homolog [Aplysia californica]
MPNTKHHKGHRNVHEDVHNNNVNGQHVNFMRDREDHHNNGDHAEARFQPCCVPAGCSDDPIDPTDPMDAVRVVCNNENCKEGNWMHKDCFIEWEQSVLSFLRSCGRARSWSEKQRLQNLWTKKGYDLAYKACDCKCGRGHLRKDLDYFPAPMNDNARKARKNKKKNDKPMPVVSTNHKSSHNNHNNAVANQHQLDNHGHHNQPQNLDNASKIGKKTIQPTTPTVIIAKRRGSDNTINNNSAHQSTGSTGPTVLGNSKNRSRNNSTSQSENGTDSEVLDNVALNGQGTANTQMTNPFPRLRTNSVSSTGSVGSQASSSGSIPSSAGSLSPLSSSPTGGNIYFKNKKGDIFDPAQPGIFRHRHDLSAFNALPRYKQNPYNIHIDDVQEDEDTRNFVLSNLTTKRMTALRCVLCKVQLPVFDKFPLVDGTLFLSPQAYDQYVVQMIWEGRIQFLNSVCIGCLEGAAEAKCSACKKPWDGSSLVVGTLYTYDIFAAMPCCQKRLTCKHCRRAVIDISNGLDYFSQYSRMIICPYCKANDYHFIKSISETYSIKESICHQ